MSGRTTTVDIDPDSLRLALADQQRQIRLHVDGLRETGADFHRRGWSLGTSSNYSVRLGTEPLELLLTASGKDKGRLEPRDFVRVDALGKTVQLIDDDLLDPNNRPSAETMLHVVLAKRPDTGAVLHTHSVWGTLLSDRHAAQGHVTITGYEMLKGLEGIATHDSAKQIEIFPNTQDIDLLAEQVASRLVDPRNPLSHGFLIQRHGLYAWGRDLAAARRHIEVFEFLFECECRRTMAGW